MTQGFKNYCRLKDEGFSDKDAFIYSQDDPERTKEIIDSADKRDQKTDKKVEEK
jgi:hypothetical protein